MPLIDSNDILNFSHPASTFGFGSPAEFLMQMGLFLYLFTGTIKKMCQTLRQPLIFDCWILSNYAPNVLQVLRLIIITHIKIVNPNNLKIDFDNNIVVN